MTKQELRATAFLVGTTIGAGIFALPWAINQVGLAYGALYLIFIASMVMMLNLIYGSIVANTGESRQLPGYAEIYLGKPGKIAAAGAIIFTLYGALLAYLVKIGQFLSIVFGLSNPYAFSLTFYFISMIIILRGLKFISRLELFLTGFVILFIYFIYFYSFQKLDPANLYSPAGLSVKSFFAPYGIILFSMVGALAIPEMKDILQGRVGKLKKCITLGTILPASVYLLFVFAIISICGKYTSNDSIAGLTKFLPTWIVKWGAGLGVLTITTSYLSIGHALSKTWREDFHLPFSIALLLALVPPLQFFLLGINDFGKILEITGAVAGGLEGIIILIIYVKSRQKTSQNPAYRLKIPLALLWILAIIFALGMLTPFI